jgi:hypothetical protein
MLLPREVEVTEAAEDVAAPAVDVDAVMDLEDVDAVDTVEISEESIVTTWESVVREESTVNPARTTNTVSHVSHVSLVSPVNIAGRASLVNPARTTSTVSPVNPASRASLVSLVSLANTVLTMNTVESTVEDSVATDVVDPAALDLRVEDLSATVTMVRTINNSTRILQLLLPLPKQLGSIR